MTISVPSDHHFLTITELLGVGLSYYKINRLVKVTNNDERAIS